MKTTRFLSSLKEQLSWFAVGKASVLFLLLAFGLPSFSQTFSDRIYKADIKSVEFYNTIGQASFPIINLRTNEQVLLSFDDLQGGSRNYYYTIEHCDYNWNSSGLAPSEYLQGLTDDRLSDYAYSSGTIQKYTHYELKLPNENIKPKMPGNYILKVFEDDDQSELILTRRLYIVDPKIGINADIVTSNEVLLRATNQKVNFQVNYAGLDVQDPNNDLHTVIIQNNRPETSIVSSQPNGINGTQLIYNDVNTNDFKGGNEFRHIDLRSLKLNSERVSKIYRDTANTVILLNDKIRDQPNYSFEYDLNGAFYIGNQDGRDPRTDADYAHVYFSVAKPPSAGGGSAYIVGQFNNYRMDGSSRLTSDISGGRLVANIFLKQGVYDYQYVWIGSAADKANASLFEGDHFETENNYQILVYYHPRGARWTELVGYRLLNSLKK